MGTFWKSNSAEELPAQTNSSAVPTGDGISQRAHRVLQQHADMFGALGMHVASGHDGEVELAESRLRFCLGYRLHRKLLSRIYHLRMKLEVAPQFREPAPQYWLEMRGRGFVNVYLDFEVRGAGAQEGAELRDRVIASGIVEELTEKVDLESLSIGWSPNPGIWEVYLEPYPGSYIYTIFPPCAYAVRLKEAEVIALRRFMAQLFEVLQS